jgi:transcriptional regulator with XRE-family HTH domain
MNISKNIFAIRNEKRLTQNEVALRMGIDQPNYARLEKRDDELSIKQLTAIAEALGVTVDDILHYGEEKPQIVDNEKVKELENKVLLLEKDLEICKLKLSIIRDEKDKFYYNKMVNIFEGFIHLLFGNKKIDLESISEQFYEFDWTNQYEQIEIERQRQKERGEYNSLLYKQIIINEVLNYCSLYDYNKDLYFYDQILMSIYELKVRLESFYDNHIITVNISAISNKNGITQIECTAKKRNPKDVEQPFFVFTSKLSKKINMNLLWSDDKE